MCQLVQCCGMEIIQIPLFLYCKWSNFVSTLYVVITIILSSFSVYHFTVFSGSRRQSICFSVSSCLFFPKHPLKPQCVGSCFSLPLLKPCCMITVMPPLSPWHGSAQAGSWLVLLFCLYLVTSETCFSFLSFFPLCVKKKKRFPAYF